MKLAWNKRKHIKARMRCVVSFFVFCQANLKPKLVTTHLILALMCFLFLPSAMKLRQGNIFTSVCQEFCPQGGDVCLSACWDTDTTPPGQTPPLGRETPPPNGHCSRWHTFYCNAFLIQANFILVLFPTHPQQVPSCYKSQSIVAISLNL